MLGRKVLVVDDKSMVRDSLRMMLEHEGCQVQAVGSGREALALFESESFDLVFLDFSMPGMKGNELLASMRARVPNQPIVMITGYAELQESSPGLFAGADHVVSKPFDLVELREIIHRFFPKEPRKG